MASITTRTFPSGKHPSMFVTMESKGSVGELEMHAAPDGYFADIRITTAHEARELAQHLQGALNACADFARTLERQANEAVKA